MSKKWQYKVLPFEATGFWTGGKVDPDEIENELNKLGAEGYELTTSVATTGAEGNTRYVILILKREV